MQHRGALRFATPHSFLLAAIWTRAIGASMSPSGEFLLNQSSQRLRQNGLCTPLLRVENHRKQILAMMTGPPLGRGSIGMRSMGNGGTQMLAVPARFDEVAEGKLLEKKGFQKGDRVILYDGVCNMCNGWVNYVLDRDREAKFKFAALQGESGKALMRKMGRNPDDLSTMVLLESDSTVHVKSEAVLRVLTELGGTVGLLAGFTLKVIPRLIRDFVYADVVAPNRYKIFGRQDNVTCRRITSKIRARFLD